MNDIKNYENPTVRGERVTVVGYDEEPIAGTLGATTKGANVLVIYPDGERGYVRQSDIYEGKS